jgi:acetyl esterase/lipase
VRARLALLAVALLACERSVAPPPPTSISAEWQEVLRGINGAANPALPGPDDVEAWQELHRAREKMMRDDAADALARFEPTVRERTVGALPALEVTPRGWRDDGRLVVQLHGGGYAFGSPRGDLALSIYLADATGTRVVSLDYPLAPAAKWDRVVPAVVDALVALAAEGPPLPRIALFGGSAGGGLAAGATLALRDGGHPLPGALVLLSPWGDVTETGDTYLTLRDAEPSYRYDRHMGRLAAAYAAPGDQRHPWVSPVYGDYTKPWPPTLIQGGTRELFLSDFVRLYQAIETGGMGRATLDLYEGMPHMFPVFLPDSAESQQALAKAKRFLAEAIPPRS